MKTISLKGIVSKNKERRATKMDKCTKLRVSFVFIDN